MTFDKMVRTEFDERCLFNWNTLEVLRNVYAALVTEPFEPNAR